jgi:hypothetical protein
MIKAIETRYAGYQFRSRLEARWAVFFDALGVKWEYEPEGFETRCGRYLPDFYLPEFSHNGYDESNLGMWVEVKPDNFKHGDDLRLEAFVEGIEQPLLLAEGLPDLIDYRICCPFDGAYKPDAVWPDGPYWTNACFQAKYLPPNPHDRNPRLFWAPGAPKQDADCRHAVRIARSARFEFGETPRFAR